VTDILAVVTRYFGGVLLGKAGLAAAYGGGVEEALRLARFLVKRRQTGFAFDVPVAQAGRVGHELRQFAAIHLGAQAGDAEWGTGAGTTVRLELWVDSAEAAEAESWLERMGAGAAPQLVGQRLVTIAE
jgi:putative IMPACT (imprinted ancient) family translation regulator